MFPRLPKVARIFYAGVLFLSVCSLIFLHGVITKKPGQVKLMNKEEYVENHGFFFDSLFFRAARTSKNSFGQLEARLEGDSEPHTSVVTVSAASSASRVVLPYNFTPILNPADACGSSSPADFLVVYVHSAPQNIKKRMTIRKTWGDADILRTYRIRLFFVMGVVENESTMGMVRLEFERFQDIVQSDYKDCYRNLTLKALAGLSWITTSCRGFSFILKTDDDIFVNIFILSKQLSDLRRFKFGQSKFILCNVWNRMRVIRDKRSKWFVTRKEFSSETYPPYCSGSAFIMSPDMAHQILEASSHTPFFWVDDVYVTGIILKAVGVKHTRFNSAYVLDSARVLDRFSKDATHSLVFYHVHGSNSMFELWRKIKVRLGLLPERANSTTTLASLQDHVRRSSH